jgi:hypothetical protein
MFQNDYRLRGFDSFAFCCLSSQYVEYADEEYVWLGFLDDARSRKRLRRMLHALSSRESRTSQTHEILLQNFQFSFVFGVSGSKYIQTLSIMPLSIDWVRWKSGLRDNLGRLEELVSNGFRACAGSEN